MLIHSWDASQGDDEHRDAVHARLLDRDGPGDRAAAERVAR